MQKLKKINRSSQRDDDTSLWDDNKKLSQRDNDDESTLWDDKKIIPLR